MTAVLLVDFSEISGSGKPIANFHNVVNFEFRNAKEPAEQIGWAYAIQGFPLGELKGQADSVVVVVDHALGDLAAFNRRDKLIAGIMYLPPEFKLVYASAERAKNQFANRGMNLADWAANKMLNSVSLNISDTNGLVPAGDGEPFAFRRVWKPTGIVGYNVDTVKTRYKNQPSV
jgi:hypothetical protein